ncbi:WD40-repeat-containing domain protein [Entophlyctis helioformis]|nr:WD40-repeat-containing domain protein [Entophlyctis helioformis]
MSERSRSATPGAAEAGAPSAAAATASGDNDQMELTLDNLEEEAFSGVQAQREQQAALDELARRRLARTMVVPTDDGRVRQRLRDYGLPMTLFGEGNGERRDRLKEYMSHKLERGEDLQVPDVDSDESDEDADEEQKEEFFTYGSDLLADARRHIRDYSLPRAKARLDLQKAEIDVPFAQRKKTKHEWYTSLQGFETRSLQFGDERPMGFCGFTPNSKILATASWSGLIKLWSVPDSQQVAVLRGHKERVSGLAFHPQSTLGLSTAAVNMVSGAADGTVNLWSLEQDTPIGKLDGHEMRVARVAFHPSGRYIGTTSFDTTWRLWDVESQQELLMQEGHSREVFALGFQTDGSLIATAGMDAIGRVWDLRTGRSILVLQGHVKPILSLDWSPNGYQMATGSEDNSIRIWDVRATKCVYTIPAHKNIITTVRYWTATDAFDNPAADDWKLPETLTSASLAPATNGNAKPAPTRAAETACDDAGGDAMAVDGDDAPAAGKPGAAGPAGIASLPKGSAMRRQTLDGSFLVSCSYDGTCKMWTDGDYKPIKTLTGLESKVMCADVSGDGKYIATALYDRTFKLYSNE